MIIAYGCLLGFDLVNKYCKTTENDMFVIVDMVSSQLQLHRYHTGRESRVVTALTLLKRHLFKLSFTTSVLSKFAPCIDH